MRQFRTISGFIEQHRNVLSVYMPTESGEFIYVKLFVHVYNTNCKVVKFIQTPRNTLLFLVVILTLKTRY